MDLYPLTNLIATHTINLGGSYFLWYKAKQCPYIREDGTACFNVDTGSAYIECPICNGFGSVWDKPKCVKAIYRDESNKFTYDVNMGGMIQGKKKLVLPSWVDTHLLKHDNLQHSARRFLRDKFELLERGFDCKSKKRKLKEVLFLQQDPVETILISGVVYKVVEVGNNY